MNMEVEVSRDHHIVNGWSYVLPLCNAFQWNLKVNPWKSESIKALILLFNFLFDVILDSQEVKNSILVYPTTPNSDWRLKQL